MPFKTVLDQREYQRQWVAKRRSDWFAENGPCQTCGSVDSLELDHVNPATKVHHAIWSWSAERREKELAKCQVLCRQCHLAKTYVQMPNRKLSSADILHACTRVHNGETLTAVAKSFSVHRQTLKDRMGRVHLEIERLKQGL